MMDRDWEQLSAILSETVEYPTSYLFKFIIPMAKVHELVMILNNHQVNIVEENTSKTGKYISISGRLNAITHNEIVSVYRAVSCIAGIISL